MTLGRSWSHLGPPVASWSPLAALQQPCVLRPHGCAHTGLFPCRVLIFYEEGKQHVPPGLL